MEIIEQYHNGKYLRVKVRCRCGAVEDMAKSNFYRKDRRPRDCCKECHKNKKSNDCKICGYLRDKKNGSSMCASCRSSNRLYGELTQPLIDAILHKAKLKPCDTCGFKPLHRCQLDIDHIDGNNSNNTKSNLQVLCANCHRLKTLQNNDHVKKG